MRSYAAARTYFSILAFLSWCMILLGVIVTIGALLAISEMEIGFIADPTMLIYLAGLAVGILTVFFGFIGLVFCQTGRAGVDSAEYGQQSLKIAREQLEISRQQLRQGAAAEAGYAALQAAKAEMQKPASEAGSATGGYGALQSEQASTNADGSAETIPSEPLKAGEVLYRGQKIAKVPGGYHVGNNVFLSLDAAKSAIDSQIGTESPAVAGEPDGNPTLAVRPETQPT